MDLQYAYACVGLCLEPRVLTVKHVKNVKVYASVGMGLNLLDHSHERILCTRIAYRDLMELGPRNCHLKFG